MFQGTLPPALRSIVHEHAASWPAGADVYVGCSGNFTVERTLAQLGRRVHSNDVNPYSCALGWWMTGQPLQYRIKDESLPDLGWLLPYLDDGPGTLATIMLGTRFLDFVGKDHPYHRRMAAGWRDQWPGLHADTVRRLDDVTFRPASFFPGDVRDHLDRMPPDAPVVMFPPFVTGGYGRMFKGITEHFDWPEPSFQTINTQGKAEIVAQVADRPHWMLGLNYLDETLEPYRVGLVQVTPRAAPWWIYASSGQHRIAGPHQKIEGVLLPKIGPDELLDGNLALHKLSPGQFAGLRSQFLDKRIAPAAPPLAIGVSCGGKLIGAFAYKMETYDVEGVYLLSDFPIGWSRYKRLSKLIVMAAISAEAQTLVQRFRSRRLTHWATTAYTNNPIFGKYGRGIPGIVLTGRKPSKNTEHEYELSYGGPLGQWTLPEALAMWTDRHASHLR